jgi:NAD(P)-dependent dehydrogenase (short-subunit alcohol dehydrogenase family)
MASLARKILILGAGSALAEQVARLYAADGAELLLVARRDGPLQAIATDLRLRGAPKVETALCDLAAVPASAITETFAAFIAGLGGADHVLIAYGVLGEQAAEAQDLRLAAAALQVNFGSAALWALAAANHLQTQGSGVLLVIGSVAGDRGRQSNYIYGAAKAGLAALMQGIAHRFGPNGPRAILIKPGPVDTPMTAHMKKGGPMWASAEPVAAQIHRAAMRGGPQVVYAPLRWRLIMLIIRLLPAPVFNRTKL